MKGKLYKPNQLVTVQMGECNQTVRIFKCDGHGIYVRARKKDEIVFIPWEYVS